MRYVIGLVVASMIGCAAAPLARGQAGVRSGYVHLGEPFSPKTLKVAALDASGTLLPAVPLALELKSASGVFETRQDGVVTAMLPPVMVPVKTAQVSFRARTICPGTAAEAFVEADI